MRRHLIIRNARVAALLVGGGVAALAQQDAIKSRKSIMKSNGEQLKAVVAMIRNQQPFDRAKAKAAFAAFADAGRKMPDLFPDNSKTGKTDASPKIWENMNDVKARFARFEQDATAAQASVNDLASLRTALRNIDKDCSECHELYRIRRR